MRGSRLTSYPESIKLSSEKVPAVNFRRLNGRVLISNDLGQWAMLKDADFKNYLEGTLEGPHASELKEKNLLRNYLNFSELSSKTIEKELLNWPGTLVHTVVTTRRCNFHCLYCHASIVNADKTGMDMSLETAKQTVDFIFSTPNPRIHIEFQGGEPLLNWGAVSFLTEYSRKKQDWSKKEEVHLSLISNLSLMDDEKLDFLAKHKVSICTSLDGPEELHNKNRLYLGGNGHEYASGWIRKIQEKRLAGSALDKPNAICTVSRYSFPHWKEIIDQAVNLGLERIQFGPLDPVGFARKSWDKIGYAPEEFVEFYAKALDYILRLNQQGVKVYEKMALIFLIRILKQGHWRFPNGDGLCRLAYNYNGDIYSCEEGRLLAHEGDEFFKVGRLGETDYASVLNHPVIRTSLMASNFNTQPLCFQCTYKPYCSTVPVMNYALQDNPWGQMPSNRWCKTMMGIFDVLFEKLGGPQAAALESWLEYQQR